MVSGKSCEITLCVQSFCVPWLGHDIIVIGMLKLKESLRKSDELHGHLGIVLHVDYASLQVREEDQGEAGGGLFVSNVSDCAKGKVGRPSGSCGDCL